MKAPRILVVEDQPVLQYVAKRQFELLGLSADLVKDGQEAVDAVINVGYDLVFMDVMLIEMDGLKATSLIRAHEAETGNRRTVIVGMTAYALQDKCLESGMDDFLQKPVMLDQLDAIVRKWTSEPGAPTESSMSEENFRQNEEQLISVQDKLLGLRRKFGLADDDD